MTPHTGNAVAPGTDLGQHARALQRVHDAVMGGAEPPARPRALVSRSWSRVLSFGLDPTRANARDPLPWAEVERRRRASPLALVVDEIRAVLTSVADASRFIVVVTDAEGTILWREGSAGVLRRADALGFTEGADLDRGPRRHQRHRHRARGAGARAAVLGRALRGGPAPVVLHGIPGARPAHRRPARHRRRQRAGAHPAPGARGAGRHRHQAGRGAAVAAPRAGAWAGCAARPSTCSPRPPGRCCSSTTTAGSPTTPACWCATGSPPHEPTARSRCPGWGCACPNGSARGGWCAPTSARCGSPPGCAPSTAGPCSRCRERRMPVAAGAPRSPPATPPSCGCWRTPRPQGLSAARLSRALFGDDEHVVTVRAEVSRLRRVVGAIVGTAPYRVADGVRLVCED